MKQEQVQIPKPRRSQESYEQSFPIDTPDETELQALGDIALQHIDEVLD